MTKSDQAEYGPICVNQEYAIMDDDHRFSRDAFLAPSAAWRGKPFWSWNGKLEKDELIRQIHVLKDMGMGGYFMHSRTGLVTPYLGKDWFALTNACVEEGERLGLESWLYDEDRWPSGTAGGMVTANPDYQMKFIYMAKLSGDAFDAGAWEKTEVRPLGAWSCRLENKIDIYDVARITPATPTDAFKGKTVLAFSVRPMASGSFYNGNTYVDTMKREATEAYIRLTHEAYKRHCGQHFGKGIKGIFTDEPHRGPLMSGFSVTAGTCEDPLCLVPWTDTLFDAFADLHGSRVEENLPALFLRENGAPVSRVKAQYAETTLQLFLENFAKPCFDWCEANNLPLTGHVLHENSLSCQVSTNGSVQRCYPWLHIPGIDYLGEHGRDYWVAKQVDSTARQFGQKWILSELYGCTGWQMNFESHKAVGAWQALFGVNLRCHHLSWYTMAGESKRDYPASILHQSPWYRDYALVETWFARLGYFRSQGEPCCDLLVLNPVESVWGRVYPGAIRTMNAVDTGICELEQRYADCFHFLAGNQVDFDYGDEALLAEHGSVAWDNGKPVLRLGAMNYTTVLLAGADTIRGTTIALLQAFSHAGGKVVVAGKPPEYIDSTPSDALHSLPVTHCDFTESALVGALRGHTAKYVRITDRESGTVARAVFCQLRVGAAAHYLTVLHTSRDQACCVDITLHGIDACIVEEWDLETGAAVPVPVGDRGNVVFTTILHTSQARCFRLVQQSALALPAKAGTTNRGSCASGVLGVTPLSGCAEALFVLDAPARYSLADRNTCVLDVPGWSFDGGEWQPAADILQIDQRVRRLCGVPVRGGDMVQPWFRGDKVPPLLGRLTLRYPIRVAADAQGALQNLQLVMENPPAVCDLSEWHGTRHIA
jgi:hypothetical protein